MTRFSDFQIYLFGSTEDRGGLVLNVDLGNVLTEKSDILVLSVLLSVRLKTLENSRPELGKVKESSPGTWDEIFSFCAEFRRYFLISVLEFNNWVVGNFLPAPHCVGASQKVKVKLVILLLVKAIIQQK